MIRNLFLIKKQRGFTLIELLVVVSIISLLSSITLASLTDAREKARDAKRVEEIRQIDIAIQLYIDTNGYAPGLGFGCETDSTDENSLCYANKTEQPAKWRSLATTLSDYIDLPTDVADYTYYSPAYLRRLTNVDCGDCKTSYTVSAPLERTNTTYNIGVDFDLNAVGS